MRILQSNEKYLTPSIVERCFTKGKLTSVDKQMTGNGFSTGFLNLKVRDDKIHIIIVPNLAVIEEKEKAYLEDSRLPMMHKDKVFTSGNRMKFFYGNSFDDNFEDADVLMFVADSFIMRGDGIRHISDRVDKVLIDEVHSVHQQSLYRKILVDFEGRVANRFSNNTALVSVTASPILFARVDIKIQNKHTPHQVINYSKDRKETIERIKEDIDNGHNVVLFTNNAGVVYNLSDKHNRSLEAKFVVGNNLFNSIGKKVTMKHNDRSKLTVVSSRGFEGFDITYTDARVYFFEDRSVEHESFSIGNLYQAINRVRKGAEYVEYCRQEVSDKFRAEFKDIKKELYTFISDTSISTEKKLKASYKKFRPYIIKVQKGKDISLKINRIAVNLYLEQQLYNLQFPQQGIMQFAEERNITFNKIETMSSRIKTRTDRDTAIQYLFSNKDEIKKRDSIPEDYLLKVNSLWAKDKVETIEQIGKAYYKELDMFLIEKNYANDYTNTSRQEVSLRILGDSEEFSELCDYILKMYTERKKAKHSRATAKEKIANFKKYLPTIIAQLLMSFARDTISFDEWRVAWRDYNLASKVGISQLEFLSNTIFNVTMDEYDIASCYPRIMYAINGKNLPDDFYGGNKKNKIAMNVYFNKFGYDETATASKKHQRQNVVRKLKSFNIDDDVITWLVDNFFESKFRGDLFNHIAFYEEQIILEMMAIIYDDGNCKNQGMARRHDSVIVFGNEDNLDFIKDFVPKAFPNTKGWFK